MLQPNQPQLAPGIRQTLRALRRRIWAYVWLQGCAAVVVYLAAAFWLSLAVDRLFEPPVVARIAIAIASMAGLAAVVYRMILRRAFVRLGDRSMATLLERRFPEFDDGLLTAVELTGRGAAECHPDMLAQTCRRAAEPISEIRLGDVFRGRPLRRTVAVALLLATSIGLFAAVAPGAVGVWARRTMMFSNELWPRKTRLVVDGFPGGMAKVARGAEFQVVAKADLGMPLVPATVRVRYRSESGAWIKAAMIREGTADPKVDRYQRYTYTFHGVVEPIELEIRGGDDMLRGLKLQVVDAPTLVNVVFHCRFPDYMDRTDRAVPAVGVTSIPQGTEVTIEAAANKPLVEVRINGGERAQQIGPPGFRSFRHKLLPLTEDKSLAIELLDTDGIRNREPIRWTLVAAPDQSPQLSLRLHGIGTAVTPRARLPVTGRVTDDYGVAEIWFEYTIEGQESGRRTIATLQHQATDVPLDDALDCRNLDLEPGQRILVTLKAVDRCDLTGEPNLGAGDRWVLDVVTPDKLRTMLEAREIVLRQRFEAIIHGIEATRDTLAQLRLDSPPAESGSVTPRQHLSRLELRVGRALQNGRKDTHETRAVAEAFDEIRAELINNRIYTEELRIRIEQRIVQPLGRIGEEMFPELDRRLKRLQGTLATADQARPAREKTLRQYDAILAAMRDVLDRMVELEDFNEAIELLRSIIAGQDKLRQQTHQRQKDKLRELLEE